MKFTNYLTTLTCALAITTTGCQDLKDFFSRMGPVEAPACDPQPEQPAAAPAQPIAAPVLSLPSEAPQPAALAPQQAAATFSIPLKDIGSTPVDDAAPTPPPETIAPDAAAPATPQIKVVDTPKPPEQHPSSASDPQLRAMLEQPEQDSDAAIQQALLKAQEEERKALQQQTQTPKISTDQALSDAKFAQPELAVPSLEKPKFSSPQN